jgi:hypothetical protein
MMRPLRGDRGRPHRLSVCASVGRLASPLDARGKFARSPVYERPLCFDVCAHPSLGACVRAPVAGASVLGGGASACVAPRRSSRSIALREGSRAKIAPIPITTTAPSATVGTPEPTEHTLEACTRQSECGCRHSSLAPARDAAEFARVLLVAAPQQRIDTDRAIASLSPLVIASADTPPARTATVLQSSSVALPFFGSMASLPAPPHRARTHVRMPTRTSR